MFQIGEIAKVVGEKLQLVLAQIKTRKMSELSAEVFLKLESKRDYQVEPTHQLLHNKKFLLQLTGRNLILLLDRSTTVARLTAAISFTGICSISVNIGTLANQNKLEEKKFRCFHCKIPERLKSRTFSSSRSFTLILTLSFGMANLTNSMSKLLSFRVN